MDVDALRSSVVDNPTDVKAFETLQTALITEQRLPELKEVYEKVFPAVQETPQRDRILRIVDQQARTAEDPGVRHWLNAQLGLLFWKQMENPDRAEVYFRRVQEAAGQTGMVAEFYTEFYARRDNWRRLEQLYDAQGLPTIEVKRRLAEVAEGKGRNDKALTFWQGVYNEDPSDQEVFAKLETLYAEVGKWHSLVELLKTRQAAAAEAGDVDGQVSLLKRMIDIFRDRIKSDTKVIRAWQQVLELQPDNRDALDALQQVYVRMKRWPDLVRILQSRVDASDDEQERLRLHREIAELMLERFSNSSEAVKHYQAILELDPHDLDAIAALKDLYKQRNAWEQFIEVSQKEISLTTESAEDRTKALIALAEVASQKIRQPRIGMSLWEEIRANDPDNEEALDQLSALYERDKAWPKLVDVLEARIEKAPDDAARLTLLEKLGQIASRRLEDDEKTVSVWRRVLEIDPKNRRAFSEMRKKALASVDLDALEWLFRNFGTIPELIRALEGQAKDLPDERKAKIYTRVADLWLEEKQTPRAVKALESVLELAPDDSEAARRLIPIYEEVEQFGRLADVYEIVIEGADESEKTSLLTAQASVYENKLEDLDQAFFCNVNAFQLDPTDPGVRAELDRLAEASDNWETWVSVVEQVVELVDDPSDKRAQLTALASVYHAKLGQYDQALDFYKRVLASDESDESALTALEAIYRETERWDELVDLLHDKLRVLSLSDEDEKSLRFDIGAVWRDQLEEPGAAMGVYREMMERFPDDLRIYDELAHLHLQAEDYAQLSEVLERKLSALADSASAEANDLADLHCKLGMLAYGQANDTERAVDHYVDALDADAGCSLAVLSLEELLSSTDHRDRIALSLEPIYTAAGAHAKLADVLEIQLASASNKKTRTSLLNRLLDLYQHELSDAERALWAASRLVEITPDKKKLHARTEALAEELGEWAHLADLYELAVDAVSKEDVRQSMLWTVAQTAHLHLDDAERAEGVYRQILEIDETHAETLDALEDVYLETGQHEQRLGILRRKETLAANDDAIVDLRFQIVSILADELDRPEDAIEDVREILGMRPDDPMALTRLDDLYGRTESWESLHDVVKQRIALETSDASRASLLVRLGTLREEKLDAVESAIETWTEILDIDVQHADAVAALERLFEGEHAPTVAPLLERSYQAADNWEGLIRCYSVMEDSADDPERQVDLHYRMAGLYEEKGAQPDQAFDHYGAAWLLLPNKDETVGQLLRLGDVLDNHEELADLLAQRVEEVEEAERRREIHRTIAMLLRDRCNKPAQAVPHLRSILDITPEDLGAIDALIQTYEQSDEKESHVEMLRVRAGLVADEGERQSLLLRAGMIAAEVDPEQAISTYEEVLGLDPSNRGALDALGNLYEQGEDWPSLCRILSRKVDLETDLAARKDIARELAAVQETALEDLDAAIDTHRTILEWDESDEHELHSLDDLYLRTERWMDLIEVLDKRIGLLTVQESPTVDLKLRKARIWREKLEDDLTAIAEFAGVLEDDPTHDEALRGLESIVKESDEREAAFDVLSAFLEIGDEWDRIYGLVGVLVENRDEVATRIEGLHRMGAIAEEHQGEPRRAFECYGRGLRQDVDHAESLAQVERLASVHGLWEDLVGLLQDIAAGCDDSLRRMQLRLRAAQILKVEVHDVDRAIAAYKEVVADEAENPEALEALDQLYRVSERWDDLLEIVRTRSELAQDEEERVGLLFRLADVAEIHLEAPDQAFESYRDVFFLQPDNADALEQLERLAQEGVQRQEIASLLEPVYVEKQQWERLLAMLELRLEDTTDPLDKLDLLKRLADVNLNNLDDPSAAVKWYGEAFRLDPEDDGLLATLEELAARTDQWNALKEVLLAVAIGTNEPERKVLLWHKGAKIIEEQLLDADQAEMIYKLILQTDGGDVPALQALDRLYVNQGRWTDLYVVLENLAGSVDFDDDRIELLLRIGALQRDQLNDPEEAIDAYVRALEINDVHPHALAAVSDLYEQSENWPALYDVLTRRSENTSDEAERLGHLRALATLAEEKLGKPQDAVELWEDVANYAPDDVRAVQNLRRLHAAAGDHEAEVEAIERELNVLAGTDPNRAADLYRDLGRLWRDVLEDPLQSQEAWNRLLEVRDSDVEAMRALEAIHAEASNFDALARIRQRMVDSLQFEGDDLLELYRELARLWSDPLPDAGRAIQSWEKVRELVPGDLEAVESLERLYSDEGRWDQAVAIMQRKAELVDDDKAIEVWMNLGELQQFQLEQWEAAAESYKKVIGVQASHAEASERLEAIFREQERWDELSDILQQRVDFTEDVEDKRELYLSLADLFENKLDDATVALLYLQAAHQESPADLDLLSQIERVAARVENWTDLLEQYQVALGVLDDEDKIDVGLRAARLLRDKMHDPEGNDRLQEAIGHYHAVLSLDEEHEAALRELSELLEQSEQWASLVEVLEKRCETAPDAYERAELGLRVGSVLANKLGEVDKAVDAYRRVLDTGEADERSIEALETIYNTTERWADLIELLETKAGNGLGDETQIRLEVGRIKEQKLDDPQGAIEVYEDILTIDDTQRDALDRLHDLYVATDRMDQLSSVYERMLHVAQSDDETVSLALKLALLAREVHQNPAQAADHYHRALAADPTNAEALDGLETIYEAGEDWEDLIDVYRRRLEQVSDDAEWARLKERQAVLYHDRLEDPDNAVFAYQELVARVPAHRPALDALEGLYQETGQPEQVQEILERKAQHAQTDAERLDLLCRRAEIVLEELSDSDGALDIANRALAIDGGHEPALTLLEKIYASRAEWENVVEALRKREIYASDDAARAKIQVRIADVYRDHIHDGPSALEHYEKAMQLVPDDVDTAERLGELYVVAEDWIKAEPLMRLIARKADEENVSDARRAEVHYSLGLCLQNCLRPEEALAEYDKALELRPGDLDALKALGKLAYETGDYVKAETIYAQIVETTEAEASDEELVELYQTLGQVAFKSGQSEKALGYLERTVELQPGHEETLEALIKVCEEQEYWQGVIQYASDLRDLKVEDIARFELQVRIGDVHLKHLDDPHSAVAAYRAALDFQTNKAAYLKIFTTLVEAEMFEDAVQTLDELVELEQDPRRKCQYLGAAGDIYREKLEIGDKAVEYYNRALDQDPSQLKLFRCIDEILTGDKNWVEQQRNYKRMLKRVQGDESQRQLQYKLAFALGEIYRTRLKQMDRARQAFEIALQFKANDTKCLEILSELLEVEEDFEGAVEMERRLLELEPNNIGHYRAIKRLYFDLEDQDRAWVSCAVLYLLSQANDREEAFYKDHAPGLMAEARTPEGDVWSAALFSKGEDLLTGAILRDVYLGIGTGLTQTTLKSLKLKKKHEVDMGVKEQFTHVYKHVVRVLGLNPAPAVYHDPTVQGVVIKDTVPPILVIGDDMRQGRTEQELAFVLSKALTYFHPLHAAVCVSSPGALETLVRAAIKVNVPRYDTSGLEAQEGFSDLLAALQEMPPQLQQSLQKHVMQFVERGEQPNVTRWLNQIELTANHAALLLCNDPVRASELIKQEKHRPMFTAPGRLSTRDKLVDLATYALSNEYLELRRALGIRVDVD